MPPQAARHRRVRAARARSGQAPRLALTTAVLHSSVPCSSSAIWPERVRRRLTFLLPEHTLQAPAPPRRMRAFVLSAALRRSLVVTLMELIAPALARDAVVSKAAAELGSGV